MSAIDESIKVLRDAREHGDEAIVAYSGGKDSVVTMELASRTFKRVHAFFMYFLPGFECVEPALNYCRERWGVEPIQLPHPQTLVSLRDGVYSNPTNAVDAVGTFNLTDIYATARHETGAKIILDGQKKTDGSVRRVILNTSQQQGANDVWHPIAAWTNPDVRAYLTRHNLVAPMSFLTGSPSSGIELTEESLLWLHDNWPQDWQKLLSVFPYAQAVVHRRDWYGTRQERQSARRAVAAAG